MTKKEALLKSGYVPHIGRPTIDGSSPSRARQLRIPDEVWDKIPSPKSKFIRDAICKYMDMPSA